MDIAGINVRDKLLDQLSGQMADLAALDVVHLDSVAVISVRLLDMGRRQYCSMTYWL